MLNFPFPGVASTLTQNRLRPRPSLWTREGWYDDQRRTPTSSPEPTPSGSDSDDDSPSAESRAAATRGESFTRLGRLSGHVQKRHLSGQAKRWVNRFVEVDDRLGLLLSYHSLAHRERRRPNRLFLLAELSAVEPLESLPGVIELRFHGADDTTAHCKLLLRCASEEDQLRWVRGLEDRIARRAALAPRAARRVTLARVRVSGLSLTAPADRAALGVEVCAVAAGSAAMAAGLRAGCRVLSINGSVVRAHRDGEALLRDRPVVATAARGAVPPLLSLVVTLPPPPRLQQPPPPPSRLYQSFSTYPERIVFAGGAARSVAPGEGGGAGTEKKNFPKFFQKSESFGTESIKTGSPPRSWPTGPSSSDSAARA